MARPILIASLCGCAGLAWLPELTDLGFVTEDSTQDNLTYFADESGDYIIVPENVQDMAEPLKISEIAEAPGFNSMSFFTGVQDNGDGTFTNYNFSPAQLIAYVSSQTWIFITPQATSPSITNNWFATHAVSEIRGDNTIYFIDTDFQQIGDTITWLNMSFVATRKYKFVV